MNDIIKNLRSIASNKQLYTVFEHFVTMTAISLQSSVVSRESERFKILEDEFKSIQQRYNKEENDLFAFKYINYGFYFRQFNDGCRRF